MHRLALTVIVLLAASFAACARDAAEYGRCDTIFDCRTGQSCAQGTCVAGPALPVGTYGIELLPASNSGSGPIRNEFSDVPFTGGDVAIEFEEPVELTGRVLVTDFANQESVGATVTITRASRIGLAKATYSIEAAAGRGSGDVAFSLRLPRTVAITDADCLTPAGDCYELRVVPSDSQRSSLPPLVKQLPLPAATHLDVALTGEGFDVVGVKGTIKDAALSGVGGLEVRALDGDGRTLSSVVTTTANGENVGDFLLTMSRSAVVDDLWLQVGASQQRPDVPKFLFALEAPGDGDAIAQVGDVVLLDFQAPVSVSYRVKGPASNGQSAPLEGALVRFTSYLSAVFPLGTPSRCPSEKCAVYSRQATTDAAGEVVLSLIPPGPSGYEVEILPGPNSPYSALHVGGVEVDQPGVGADFTLGRKLEIRGAVVDALGQMVAGATVTATPRGLPESAGQGNGLSPSAMRTADLALDEPPSTMQTDPAGQFLLMLEPGVSYEVVVTPSASSPHPISTLTGLTFERAGTLNIELPQAALLAGSVTSWDGADAAGALVRIFEVVADPDTGEKTAWLRGEAVTQTDGGFKLLLPAGAAVAR